MQSVRALAQNRSVDLTISNTREAQIRNSFLNLQQKLFFFSFIWKNNFQVPLVSFPDVDFAKTYKLTCGQ